MTDSPSDTSARSQLPGSSNPQGTGPGAGQGSDRRTSLDFLNEAVNASSEASEAAAYNERVRRLMEAPDEIHDEPAGPIYGTAPGRDMGTSEAIGGGTFLDRAKHMATGLPVPRNRLTEDSLVTLPNGGGEWRVGELLRTGEVAQTKEGWFYIPNVEAPSPGGEGGLEPTEDPDDGGHPGDDDDASAAEYFSDEIEAELVATASRISEASQDILIAALANKVQLDGDMVSAMAREASMSQEAAEGTIAGIADLLMGQAAASIDADLGGHGEAALRWAYESGDPEINELWKDAVYAQTELRSTRGYREIGKLYLENLPYIAPEEVKYAAVNGVPEGVALKFDQFGDAYFEVGTDRLYWRLLVREGMLKIRKRV